jgi:hypothetical protein
MREGSGAIRLGSGVSMIVSPLLWFASSVLGPGHEASRHLADMLPPIAADPNRFLVSVLLGLVSLAVLLPASLGLAHLLRQRMPVLALSGAAFVLIGVLSLAAVQGVQLVQQQMVDVTADKEQMIALLHRLESGIGLKVIFAGSFGLFLGWIILSAGLFLTRLVPRAIPVLILASLGLNLFGLERVSRLLFLLGLGWLGLAIMVRQEIWEPARASDGTGDPGHEKPAPGC